MLAELRSGFKLQTWGLPPSHLPGFNIKRCKRLTGIERLVGRCWLLLSGRCSQTQILNPVQPGSRRCCGDLGVPAQMRMGLTTYLKPGLCGQVNSTLDCPSRKARWTVSIRVSVNTSIR